MPHNRTKHIDVKVNLIGDTFKRKIVNLQYLCSKDMTADVLTKPLYKGMHQNFTKSLGLNCKKMVDREGVLVHAR